MKRIVAAMLLTVTLLCLLGSCTKPSVPSTSEGKVEDYQFTETAEQTNFVKIEMMDGSIILVELYPDIAPKSVENFVKLAESGFYDGLTFHRIVPGFVIQGGDPLGNGTGGSGQTIKGEFSSNGVNNTIAHERGVLSMARSSAPDSASSQFFIMHAKASHLDGSYAAFGHVLSGMEVVDAICQNTPVTDGNGTVAAGYQPVITSITVIEKPAE